MWVVAAVKQWDLGPKLLTLFKFCHKLSLGTPQLDWLLVEMFHAAISGHRFGLTVDDFIKILSPAVIFVCDSPKPHSLQEA